MPKIPAEVAEALQLESAANDSEDTIVQRVIKRIISMFGQLAASEEYNQVSEQIQSNESTDNVTNTCSEDTSNGYTPAYGYPPAYGVPANVAVKLLQEALVVLEKVADSNSKVKDEAAAVAEKIREALGVASSGKMSSQMADWLSELQLAIAVQQGTQPVLPPAEAANRLNAAWEQWADVVRSGVGVGVGRVFDAMFALRAAVQIAYRSLLAVQVSPENAEKEADEEADKVEAQSGQDAPQEGISVPRDSNGEQGQFSEPGEQVQGSMAAQSTETTADQAGADAPSSVDLKSVVMQLLEQVSALNQKVDALETQIRERRRVTLFASTQREESPEDDLIRRWNSATTESERKRILREAQKLLAAPRPLERD
jgi:hypothetical protein